VQKVRVKEGGRTEEIKKEMIEGVTVGHKGMIRMKGVGYRAEMKGDTIAVYVGYREAKRVKIKAGIEVTVGGGVIIGKSARKGELREYLSKIEEIRPARKDKYKGKGIERVTV
jgi:large subunit ribosomal protein L6